MLETYKSLTLPKYPRVRSWLVIGRNNLKFY